MTKTEFEISRVLYKRSEYLKGMMRKLKKAAAVMLVFALSLSFVMSLSKRLPFCYSVRESTVQVEAGDTLWDIALENKGEYPYGIRSYIAEIRRLNNMTSSSPVLAGQSIKLPIYSYKLA